MQSAEDNFIHRFGWILPGRRLDSGGAPNLKMLQNQADHKVIHWDLPGTLIDQIKYFLATPAKSRVTKRQRNAQGAEGRWDRRNG
jgi:hypothetical protein